MTDTAYLDLAEATLDALEAALEQSQIDIDTARSGSILTLEFENSSKIIIHLQPALQEIWVAAQRGGFHYRYQPDLSALDSKGVWRDTRNGNELFAALSDYVSEQAGHIVKITP